MMAAGNSRETSAAAIETRPLVAGCGVGCRRGHIGFGASTLLGAGSRGPDRCSAHRHRQHPAPARSRGPHPSLEQSPDQSIQRAAEPDRSGDPKPSPRARVPAAWVQWRRLDRPPEGRSRHHLRSLPAPRLDQGAMEPPDQGLERSELPRAVWPYRVESSGTSARPQP